MNRRFGLMFSLMTAIVSVAACNPGGNPVGVTKSSTPTTYHRPSTRPTDKPTPTPAGAELHDSPLPLDPSPQAFSVPSPSPVKPSVAPGGTPKPDAPVIPPQEQSSDGKTHVTGYVYGLDGTKLVQGINVTFVPVSGGGSTITYNCDDQTKGGTQDGGYLSGNDVTPGTYKVTAVGYGFTPRTRLVEVQKGFKSTISFGTPGADDECYGLSPFPEVTGVDIGDPTQVDGSHLSLTIHLSEPLTPAATEAFQSELALVPLDSVADAGDSPPDVNASNLSSVTVDKFKYVIGFPIPQPSQTPKTIFGQAISSNWNKLQDLSISWGLPLLNSPKGAKYQLIVQSDPAHVVVDTDSTNHQLGMDDKGSQTAWPPASQVVNKVFLAPHISADTFKKDSLASRWASTHVNAFQFTLKPDATPPTLTGFECSVPETIDPPAVTPSPPILPSPVPSGNSTLIKLHFSESLAAFGPGANGAVSATTCFDLANYSFAVGLTDTYLKSVEHLDGVSHIINQSSDSIGFGHDGGVLGKEFKVTNGTVAPVTCSLDEHDPTTVILTFANPFFFNYDWNNPKATSVLAIEARVSGIQDPAGNAIAATQADPAAAQPVTTVGYTAKPH